jgi:hypothetical protein
MDLGFNHPFVTAYFFRCRYSFIRGVYSDTLGDRQSILSE